MRGQPSADGYRDTTADVLTYHRQALQLCSADYLWAGPDVETVVSMLSISGKPTNEGAPFVRAITT